MSSCKINRIMSGEFYTLGYVYYLSIHSTY